MVNGATERVILSRGVPNAIVRESELVQRQAWGRPPMQFRWSAEQPTEGNSARQRGWGSGTAGEQGKAYGNRPCLPRACVVWCCVVYCVSVSCFLLFLFLVLFVPCACECVSLLSVSRVGECTRSAAQRNEQNNQPATTRQRRRRDKHNNNTYIHTHNNKHTHQPLNTLSHRCRYDSPLLCPLLRVACRLSDSFRPSSRCGGLVTGRIQSSSVAHQQHTHATAP